MLGITGRLRILVLFVSTIVLALAGLVFIRNLVDFRVYYAAGQSLLAGRTDLYAANFALGLMDYRYPPFFIVAFYPLWALSYPVSAYVWYGLSIGEIAVSVFLFHRLLAPSRLVWLIALLATGQYFVMILHYGNAHLLALCLVFASFYYFARKRDALAALAMALAITIKITPVLLLPYFAIKRRWKLLAFTAVFLGGLNLAPAAYFGFQENARLLAAWHEHVIADQEFHEIVNGPINLGLKGELRRYLTDFDYSQRLGGDTRYRAVNLFSLPTALADRVWMAVTAAVYGLACGLIWLRSKKDEDARQLALEAGLMIVVMLFAGPLTSKIYFIALLWPVVALTSFAFGRQGPAAAWSRRVLIVIAAANLILPLLPGRDVQRLLLVVGADFFVNLLLMAALFAALWQDRPRTAAAIPAK